MTIVRTWHRLAAGLAATVLLIAGCAAPPAYRVVEEPASRIGVVESVRQESVQNVNTAVGTIGGAVVGGALGSLIGGGTGQTLATIVGAVGGGYVGNEAARRSQTLVWRIDVRYDDGSLASIQQTSPPSLRVGDRVRVTANGIERLR